MHVDFENIYELESSFEGEIGWIKIWMTNRFKIIWIE